MISVELISICKKNHIFCVNDNEADTADYTNELEDSTETGMEHRTSIHTYTQTYIGPMCLRVM